jgi:hypothetical protein
VDDIDDGAILIDETVSEDTIMSPTVRLDVLLDRVLHFSLSGWWLTSMRSRSRCSKASSMSAAARSPE